ncbi:MAG: mandelate racemase/muconate lactonizing enzyme family protein [Rhodospirillales bacterium]|nr:MAG: mandelate racemase/muconate lactonizing enzyme family protein [Rhodospirillales bacterium]
MKIAQIRATIHAAASAAPLLREPIEDYRGGPPRPFVACRVRTDAGLIGHGFTGRFLAPQVADLLETAILPEISDMDPCDPPAVQRRLRERLNPRGMTGVIASAMSALDIALWDIRGQAEGRSIAAMIGGARDSVPVYVTFGMPQYDIGRLVEAARRMVADGYRMLKMVVAVDPGGWREDARRVHAVCDAIEGRAQLIVDANEGFTAKSARRLAQDIRDRPIAWFEEPVAGNDAMELARLRDETGIRVGAGQMEADPRIFALLLDRDAVDILQPNVLYCGGFSGGTAIADAAARHAIRLANGAGWRLINMHLLAGVPNGWVLEHHIAQSGVEAALFVDPPNPVDGRVAIPENPGLGLEVSQEGLDATQLR